MIRRRRGFTLTETLLVLALTAMLVGTVGFSMRAYPSLQLNQNVRVIAAQFRAAHRLAILQGAPIRAVVMPRMRQIEIQEMGFNLVLPAKLTLRATGAASVTRQEGQIALVFWPDGSTSGLELAVSSVNTEQIIQVNWLTGRVSHTQGSG